MHEPFLYKLVPVVVGYLGQAFPEIAARADYVSTVIESEEASFGRTLDRGIEIFADAAESATKSERATISGEDAFQLYDTYGFPLDLTQLMAEERALQVDTEKFNELMEQQRERARSAQKSDSLMAALADTELPATEDVHKYHADSCESKILGWINNEGFAQEGRLQAGDEAAIVLEKTCLYAEAGGQIGDCGLIETDDAQFVVEATAKIANCVIHRGKLAKGSLQVGQEVKAVVSKDRNSIKKNHSATHLLQWALQQTLGDSVAQQGSYVAPDYLRFDFTYPKALTADEIDKIETLVREKILADLPVTWSVMPRAEAEKLGAMALFGEKYGDEVRVVCLGAADETLIDQAFSREFCGGTHVEKLGSIGNFKIIKEESISTGVRRITALTGAALNDYLEKASGIVEELSAILKVAPEALPDRVAKLLQDNKQLAKDLKSAARGAGSDAMGEARKLLDGCEKIGESSIIVGRLSTGSVEQAREAIDMLKKKAKSAVVVIGLAQGENKAMLLAGVTEDLIQKGIKAGDIVKAIAPIVNGGGGGRPQMAQAGGKDPGKIEDALAKAADIVKTELAEG
ncbi:MAG: alanine--tRNA ligase [Planctomycetota bacterium]|jgi:alanyl-tRNA synthetase